MKTKTSPIVLAARDVSKRFGGVQALDGVSVEVRAGKVHCIAGENGCGKSTLIKVISGVEQPDTGSVEIDGTALGRITPRDAIRAGVQVIYQDFSLFPNLTVAENIAITGFVAEGRSLVDPRELRRRAQAVVDELDVRLDLEARVEQLTVADRQLTAICRALAEDARVIFMDEPTTALTHREVSSLFRVVRKLQTRGVAMVFVSHKLEEVLEISDHITVIRNGRVSASGPVADFDRASLGKAMTGREVYEERQVTPLDHADSPVLQVRDLALTGMFHDVTFDVMPGEILGITGLLGSGRTEIAESLFGMLPATHGEVLLGGVVTRINSVQDAVAAGIGYVPADRLTQGLFLDQSIADNMIAGSLDLHRGPAGTLDRRAVARTVHALAQVLRIKAASTEAPIRSLSGGNQQRVALAKWLARKPRLLILNSPTVGVDVGSKEDILTILRTEAEAGMGVIVISDDVSELVAVCHRVLVVREGEISSALAGDDVSESGVVEALAA